MRYSTFILAVCAVVSLPFCVKQDVRQQQNSTSTAILSDGTESIGTITAPEYVADQLLIKFKAGTSAALVQDVLAAIKGTVKEPVATKAMQATGDTEGFLVVNTLLETMEAVAIAKTFIEVQFAEPNFISRHLAVSNDPLVTSSDLWGMHGTNGSQAVTAWSNDKLGSKSVVVGVIDEGIEDRHPDLQENMWTNAAETVNGIDDDGNGYIDDINGWDFYNNDNSTYDGVEDDHGTHIAGTIGAKGGNGIGVAGVCWNVSIISAKFMGANGGDIANAVKAIDYLVYLKQSKGVNLVAVNASWGGPGYSDALLQAIGRANNVGILFVAAAGNSATNIDNYPVYPASYTTANIISVAALDKAGALPKFSNYGAKGVDLGAPGVGILSTAPGGQYKTMDGTSMGAPHITGAVALYAASKSLHPTTASAASTIKNALLNTSAATKSLNRKTVTGGRLNVSTF